MAFLPALSPSLLESLFEGFRSRALTNGGLFGSRLGASGGNDRIRFLPGSGQQCFSFGADVLQLQSDSLMGEVRGILVADQGHGDTRST